jgi:hypothetical protein
MRNIIATAVVVGSLVIPTSFMFWSTPASTTEGLHDVRSHHAPATRSVELDTPGSIAGNAPHATGTAESLSREEQELVTWAHDRFALVGLDLPQVDITFDDDTETCGGHDGRYRGSGERRHIAVCVPDRGSFASHLHRRRTLVHELAHAWDHANLEPQDRADLLEILDASDWYAPESDWDERGIERFAETITWGLYDQARRPVLIDVPCRELHADFQAITGTRAPGPLEPVCNPTSHAPRSNLTKGSRT